ncbi:ribosomal-protein-alanine N-acetyltransferase [Kribbella steppae]|uniref:Ribosomal-protein-alanine N-acetyltransferase n=1 Tax=Kribbella steppae TaxID=2512223 RepID=A0A4R2H1G1_9ACTN|nr:GNAT family N-acetyltransferase [Kribbella steppae]TCO18175.1 ribosomal-protein-alanine N-acetyltransferase [Kribbella steppae]
MYLPDHKVNLERLTAAHADAVLAFEVENRKYFAASIQDRGDAYFTEFGARLAGLLAEQEAGICRFHVLVDDSGAVVGRVNLVDFENGSAELGYRIAESATGKGLASAAVRALIGIAAPEYGLTALRAGTSVKNLASQVVLERAGFRLVGDDGAERVYELKLEAA